MLPREVLRVVGGRIAGGQGIDDANRKDLFGLLEFSWMWYDLVRLFMV
jgi:hypothetical protein